MSRTITIKHIQEKGGAERKEKIEFMTNIIYRPLLRAALYEQ